MSVSWSFLILSPVIPLKNLGYGQQLRVRIKFGTSLWLYHKQNCKKSDILGIWRGEGDHGDEKQGNTQKDIEVVTILSISFTVGCLVLYLLYLEFSKTHYSSSVNILKNINSVFLK